MVVLNLFKKKEENKKEVKNNKNSNIKWIDIENSDHDIIKYIKLQGFDKDTFEEKEEEFQLYIITNAYKNREEEIIKENSKNNIIINNIENNFQFNFQLEKSLFKLNSLKINDIKDLINKYDLNIFKKNLENIKKERDDIKRQINNLERNIKYNYKKHNVIKIKMYNAELEAKRITFFYKDTIYTVLNKYLCMLNHIKRNSGNNYLLK